MPKCWSVSLQDCCFRDTRSSKIGYAPNDPKLTLNSQKYSTLNTYRRGPNVGPFRSTTSCFPDTRSSKIANAPNDPKNELEHLTVKSTLYALNAYP